MFISRKKMGPMISTSCDRPALRFFLLIGIFCLTFSAFWWHFDRRIDQLSPESKNTMIIDENKLLSPKTFAVLEEWQRKFSESWNVPLLIQASSTELEVPEYAVNTLYVGAGLLHKQGVISLPPLVRKIVGEGVRLTTEEELAACLKKEDVGMCLENSLQTLWNSFAE